jgi:MYXO-CTERM domain-containing protein
MRLNGLICHLVFATLFFAFTMTTTTTTTRAAQPTRIYHVGNSLTGQSANDHLKVIAAERGIDSTPGHDVRSGKGLGFMHANPQDVEFFSPSGYSTALPNNTWDVVTLQTYGDTYDTNKNAIQHMVNLARSNPANQATKFYIFEGWPQIFTQVSDDYSTHWLSTYDPNNHSDSGNRLKSWSRGYSDELMSQLRGPAFNSPVEIKRIRTGEVFYQLDQLAEAGQLGTTTEIEQWYGDDFHMGEFGAYASRLTMFATVYGQNPTGLSAPAAMTPEVAAKVQQTIWNVVTSDPYSGVTVPEPSGLALLGVGAVALLRRRRPRRQTTAAA